MIDGVEVISADQAKSMQETYNITIAAGYHFVAEIMEQFEQAGITRYSVFQLLNLT